MISRFKPTVWVVAVVHDERVLKGLLFSYGVQPTRADVQPGDWREFASQWLADHQVSGDIALLAAGASPQHPDANYRIEFMLVGEAVSRKGLIKDSK